MPVMDGLQATRLIRSFEENGYWDASVGPTCQSSPASSALSQDCYDETRKRKRTPIIAVTHFLFILVFRLPDFGSFWSGQIGTILYHQVHL